MIDNMTLSTSEHMEQFYDAARWFVANQNITSGGWPNPVRRKVAPGMAVLEPGWYICYNIFKVSRIICQSQIPIGNYLGSKISVFRCFENTKATMISEQSKF